MAAKQEAPNDLFALAEQLGIEVSVPWIVFLINYTVIRNYAKVNHYVVIFVYRCYINNIIIITVF